jgi:hypothetical protein
MLYIAYLNKQHEKRRVAMGKSAKIIDRSMQAVGEPEEEDKGEDAGKGETTGDDNAFKDLTDFENEDFVFVY